jgi:hypothetical protein
MACAEHTPQRPLDQATYLWYFLAGRKTMTIIVKKSAFFHHF